VILMRGGADLVYHNGLHGCLVFGNSFVGYLCLCFCICMDRCCWLLAIISSWTLSSSSLQMHPMLNQSTVPKSRPKTPRIRIVHPLLALLHLYLILIFFVSYVSSISSVSSIHSIPSSPSRSRRLFLSEITTPQLQFYAPPSPSPQHRETSVPHHPEPGSPPRF
jgi:hypothetical protein